VNSALHSAKCHTFLLVSRESLTSCWCFLTTSSANTAVVDQSRTQSSTNRSNYYYY